MRLWHILSVFLKGASLFDHDEMHTFKTAVSASTQCVWSGVHSYESSWERNELENPPKKEVLLKAWAITKGSTKVYY